MTADLVRVAPAERLALVELLELAEAAEPVALVALAELAEGREFDGRAG